MNEPTPSAPSPVPEQEIRRLREALDRAVARICPAWLAADRDDIVQNATLRVVQALRATEESTPSTASYVWKAAHSAVMDEIRKRRRSRELGMDSPELDRAPGEDSPERQRSAAELRDAIGAGLRRLKPPRRWAVLLYLYGFSLEESARVLGWKRKRVDNQRYQGLAELRTYLGKRGFEP